MTLDANHHSPRLGQGDYPPGRIKIVQALVGLLSQNDFSAITTAEIAKTAGVTEALIYKYFKDKRDLLYQVLTEFLQHYKAQADRDLGGVQGALNKLRKIIWGHINVYATDRTFARILLLEVRSYSDYYTSGTYRLVKEYSDIVLQVIEEGIASGEIRDDLPPTFLRQVVLGSIEHVCLTGVAFDREMSPDDLTEKLCRVIFRGIAQEGGEKWTSS
ncbi:MAG: TetR/AcrR family transcriptional regulator [Proteobacteria bacterium]|nr:TetR/AcrR family transcriptional regulator [Pseudomonadota bacterium]MBU1742714.1 TetR/AcrR family transcriptional regulator [Pseudomonadota bacterium]